MDVDTDLEQLMDHLGEFGPYQLRQFLLHLLAAMTAGMHMLSLVTVAAVPDHRCFIPDLDNRVESSIPWNTSLVQGWIPLNEKNEVENCFMYDESNSSVMCDKWVYDPVYHQSSRAIEWDLVCSRRWMGAVAQSVYMFGVFTGAVVLGSMADKFGRKTVFYVSAVLQLILGVVVAFVPEFTAFLVVRFFYGMFGSAGSYITGFVLTMEIVGPSKRTACGISFQASFAFGLMLVAMWGYIVPDRMWLQVIYGLHSLVLIGHWWLIDESPRWLWAQGRVLEAVHIVERGVKQNKSEKTLDVAEFVTKGKAAAGLREDRAYGVTDLLKTPNLRKKTLNVCLNWFANSLAYYSLSLNTGKMPGNPFFILFLAGLIEIPSYIMTTLLVDRTGRRSLISTLMLLGGTACIIGALIPTDTAVGSVSVTTVAMLGKFFIAGSFAIIYNYTAELFPTVVRNTALGVGSMCARLSGALTPLITLLDSFDKTLPTIIFASIALTSGLLALLLPETLDQPMPQTLEDGERFGIGDTACTSCLKDRKQKKRYEVPLDQMG